MTSISEPFTVFESDASKSHVKLGEWMLVESLGSGTFGKVKLGVHERTGAKVAVKILNRDVIKALDVVGKIRREIQNLSLFRHPHIIRLHSVTSTPTDIFMIMEYVSGGELFDHIVKKGKLNSTEARRFFQQIISGVHYCHLHKVVHRDLKPENLLLDEDLNVKIADFGLSNLMTDGDFMRTSCGSPNYAAPEVINGHLYCGPEVDVWSCGVILYALLCGTLPFDDEHVPTLFKKIKSGIFHIPSHVHRDAANLLRRMLEVDPAKRATMQEIINHPWFQVDLPGYLFPPANETPNIVDMVAVRDVVARYDVAEEDVTSALLSEIPDHPLAVAYNLIVDNKRAVNEGMRLDDFLNARMPETPKTIRGSSRFENHDNNMVTPPTDTGKKKSRWHLGIRSSCKPREIMMQVFKALKKLNFEWRVVDAYRLVVRKRFVASTPPRKPKDMPCITLQLYQVRTDHFLLDFKYIVEEKKPELLPSIPSGRRYSYSTSVLENDVICDEADVFPTVFEEPLEDDVVADEPELPSPPTMLFFEMCVELINALAHR